MNTLLKLFKHSAGMALGLLLLMSPAAHAAISPATVLAINTDTANKKLYVEVSYIGRPCLIYQLKFGLEILRDGNPFGGVDPNIARPFKVVTGAGDSVVWRIDGNDETNANKPSKGYITKVEGDDSGNNDTLMYDMQISGYRLEFDLATISGLDRLRPSDSINVCLRSQMKPIECKGCGTAGSDRMFSLNDIAADCPYDYQNKEDMVACYQRDSKVANWEGWFVDARDCKRYRTVQMPDGKWWMAQNLNFRGTSGNALTFADYLQPAYGAALKEYNGIFWCPDSATATVPLLNYTADTVFKGVKGSLSACDTYGALYPFPTIMTKDGKTTSELTESNSDYMAPTALSDGVASVRGICPEGWLLPTNNHWGKMLNLVEKNCEDTSKHYGCTTTGENAPKTGTFITFPNDSVYYYNPCMHIDTSADFSTRASACAYKDLLSTNVAPYREMDTVPNYHNSNTGGNEYTMVRDGNRRVPYTVPKVVRRYATVTNPVWSYFSPETAGTDKYGFSILPAGLRLTEISAAKVGYYYLGELAIFSSSTSKSSSKTDMASSEVRSFQYNALLTNIIPNEIRIANRARGTGVSVRCIADSN